MSVIRLTLPLALKKSIMPPAPTGTTAMFGIALLSLTLRLYVDGRAAPSGHAVRKVVVVAPTAVRLSTTAVAVAGTPPAPVTLNVSMWPPAIGPTGTPGVLLHVPVPVRVSNIRHGPVAVNVAPPLGEK